MNYYAFVETSEAKREANPYLLPECLWTDLGAAEVLDTDVRISAIEVGYFEELADQCVTIGHVAVAGKSVRDQLLQDYFASNVGVMFIRAWLDSTNAHGAALLNLLQARCWYALNIRIPSSHGYPVVTFDDDDERWETSYLRSIHAAAPVSTDAQQRLNSFFACGPATEGRRPEEGGHARDYVFLEVQQQVHPELLPTFPE